MVLVRVWRRGVVRGGTGRPTVSTPAGYRYALLSRYRSGRRGSGGSTFVYLVSFEVMKF